MTLNFLFADLTPVNQRLDALMAKTDASLRLQGEIMATLQSVKDQLTALSGKIDQLPSGTITEADLDTVAAQITDITAKVDAKLTPQPTA